MQSLVFHRNSHLSNTPTSHSVLSWIVKSSRRHSPRITWFKNYKELKRATRWTDAILHKNKMKGTIDGYINNIRRHRTWVWISYLNQESSTTIKHQMIREIRNAKSNMMNGLYPQSANTDTQCYLSVGMTPTWEMQERRIVVRKGKEIEGDGYQLDKSTSTWSSKIYERKHHEMNWVLIEGLSSVSGGTSCELCGRKIQSLIGFLPYETAWNFSYYAL